MNWETIFSERRTGEPAGKERGSRSGFQRDFDRLIFSSAFRRLQNKTQVFPLPGTAFVHNRLTHSLEVASVGRSLGKIIGERLCKYDLAGANQEVFDFYKYELPNVIAAGCLAHDIGNPAFGHSGEKAISAYFINHASDQIGDRELKSFFSPKEWKDLTNFEGNANALRVLTHTFQGKSTGGYRLTYTTLASILKYPCDSSSIDKSMKHRKKYGFFQSEAGTFRDVVEELGMIEEAGGYKRHPFVYLVEAADDICYRVIDMEDAHRLGIVSLQEISEAFTSVIGGVGRPEDDLERIQETCDSIADENEKVSYLRAKCINTLAQEASDVFYNHRGAILQGKFDDTLVDNVQKRCQALEDIEKLSREKIYNHRSVIEIEIAGFNVMSELLELFVPALLREKPTHLDRNILHLIPSQFSTFKSAESAYVKVQCVLDFISGMTDSYVTEFYRKLKGIEIPKHN